MPLDGYTVADTFASITYNTSVTVPYSANNPGAIAVDWPYVYFTVGTQLYVVYVDTVTTGALKEYPPAALIATLRGVARKITISGDLMLIGEDPGASVNLVEAFSIASNANVTPVGNSATRRPSTNSSNTTSRRQVPRSRSAPRSVASCRRWRWR